MTIEIEALKIIAWGLGRAE